MVTADPVATSAPEPGALQPLVAYDIDKLTGFVPGCDPLARLDERYAAWEALVPDLSAAIRSRRIRSAIKRLPSCDPIMLETRAERERALLLLSVFANAWVWGGDAPDLVIPHQLARPLCALAEAMDRPPIVHYASMALHNWQRIDPQGPLSTENMRMQVQFLGGVDEDWFFIASLGVELAGAPLLDRIRMAAIASRTVQDGELAAVLGAIAAAMKQVIAALHRMGEWCDPHIFYHRVRPFLTGWPSPGVIYEGVSATPREYVGGSAGQSSLIQAVDAVLGIAHHAGDTRDYLRMLRRYMPVEHRRFVEDVERCSCVRERARNGSAELRSAYNAALNQVAEFRRGHGDMAQRYITRIAVGSSPPNGTGGTSLAAFLDATHCATVGNTL